MFKTLRNAFKVKDIRDRILFTFLMLIIIRIGSELPAPGVDGEVFKQWWASQSADGLGFFNAITGGSFLNMSVFALNITPYITSSIIIQLLTIAIPKLEEIQRDGEEGRKKMVALTRYVTIVLALIQSIAMTIGFYRGGYLTGQGPLAVIEVITGLTAGSAVLMWIGERITEKGIGNGYQHHFTYAGRYGNSLESVHCEQIHSKGNRGRPDHYCNHRCNGSIRSSTSGCRA